MTDLRIVAAFCALLLAASPAPAAIILGGVEFTGRSTHSSDPFEIGATVTLGDSAAVRTASEVFLPLADRAPVDLSSVTWTLDKSANVGLRFGIDIFDIEVTGVQDVRLPDAKIGWIIARGVVSAPGHPLYAPTDALILLAANNATDTYRMNILSGAFIDEGLIPHAPVQAALPMLVGGLGLLAAAAGRRHARRA